MCRFRLYTYSNRVNIRTGLYNLYACPTGNLQICWLPRKFPVPPPPCSPSPTAAELNKKGFASSSPLRVHSSCHLFTLQSDCLRNRSRCPLPTGRRRDPTEAVQVQGTGCLSSFFCHCCQVYLPLPGIIPHPFSREIHVFLSVRCLRLGSVDQMNLARNDKTYVYRITDSHKVCGGWGSCSIVA